jgi:septal ring factor EnvC (AmiA/AmiB activator)
MKNFQKLVSTTLAVALFAGMLSFTACSGVSEEQIAELQALQSEVKSLEKEVNGLKSEKTKLEREIAEQNAKLDQCAKDKAETEANLKKIMK